MRSANALLCLPKKDQSKEAISPGSKITALLTGPLAPPEKGHCYHGQFFDAIRALEPAPESTPYFPPGTKTGKSKIPMRVGLLTISDRASQGVYSDESGPEMARLLEEFGNNA